jgi:hypothetical protein
MTAADDLRDTAEAMFSASVIPHRSVERIRRALNEDPPRVIEGYLRDIERGMVQIRALYAEMQPDLCPICGGTGRAVS